MLTIIPTNCHFFSITSSNIADVIATQGVNSVYDKIKVEVVYNCCPTLYTDEIPAAIGQSAKDTELTSSQLIVSELLFAFDPKLQDGIYNIKVTIVKKDGSTIIESNCLFLDCSTGCSVMEAVEELETEEDKVHLLMLHYGLTQGSGCGCNCDELCNLYKRMIKLMQSTTLNSPCGCGS